MTDTQFWMAIGGYVTTVLFFTGVFWRSCDGDNGPFPLLAAVIWPIVLLVGLGMKVEKLLNG